MRFADKVRRPLAAAPSLRLLGRWWAVGSVFLGIGIGVLYVLIDILGMPLILGTLLAAEITTILRFAINDRWVFGHRHLSLARCWQFHVACAGGAAIWFALANTLPRFGIHYLIASAMGSALSVLFSMGTNFMWIWRKPKECAPATDVDETGKSVEPAHGS